MKSQPKKAKKAPANKKRVTRASKPAAGAVKVTLTIGDQVYQAQADTIEDALSKLKPESVKRRCVFRVDSNDRMGQIIVPIPRAKQALETDMARSLLAKRLAFFLS